MLLVENGGTKMVPSKTGIVPVHPHPGEIETDPDLEIEMEADPVDLVDHPTGRGREVETETPSLLRKPKVALLRRKVFQQILMIGAGLLL